MRVLLIAVGVLLAPPHVLAQAGPEESSSVEVLGLSTWTVAMLQDSLARYGDGMTLADAACAVVLRDVLGFADAAVQTWPNPEGGFHTVVMVIEPRDSINVQFLPLPPDSAADRPEWSRVIGALREDPGAGYAVQDYAFFTGETNSVFGRTATKTQRAVRDGLLALSGEARLEHALTTLAHDRNQYNRIAATLLLAHLPNREEAWHGLIRALRTEPDFAGSYTALVLGVLGRERPRRVSWQIVTNDLRYLIAGTNLFAFLEVMDVLVRTEIDPVLAADLVRAHPQMIIAALGASHVAYRRPAHALLVRARGEDLGPEAEAWREWLSSGSGATPNR